MNRHLKRLDLMEKSILATMPLDPDLEALLQHLADKDGIPPDELRQEAVRVAMVTRGMTDDEMLAHVAGELGCSTDTLRHDIEAADAMRSIERRLSALERLCRHAEHPARIPDWLRPWIDPLSIEDLDILETGLSHEEAGGDVATLPPEIRERYGALCESYAAFVEEHHR